ncbi:hypothetical protein [Streptosporangium minutum]|uniref:Uncharacterized protein n=1 Tax=Streptosporangium minutum TaxID=569862 RepID=A0A243RLS8_9ACTN|nr:hypothetical protein [Streptosporangium minutum]OUC95854.1 hypothetical protein CA984_17265 [Streptosporangium minutum]
MGKDLTEPVQPLHAHCRRMLGPRHRGGGAAVAGAVPAVPEPRYEQRETGALLTTENTPLKR